MPFAKLRLRVKLYAGCERNYFFSYPAFFYTFKVVNHKFFIMKKTLTIILLGALALMWNTAIAQQPAGGFPFQNPSLTTEERVADLVSRMTLKEKADQLLYTSPAIPHLGIPSYNWWNEALHGVARAGYATVFPQ